MKTVAQNIHINQSPALVFAKLADPHEQMKFDGDMMLTCEKITGGAIGKGTRFRGSFKGMGVVEYEYAEFVQDKLIEHSVKMPFGAMRHRFQFEPEGSATLLKQSIVLYPNFLGNMLWSIVMKKKMLGRMVTLNERIKKYAEGLS